MQDQRRRGEKGDLLDRAVHRAINNLLAKLPPEQHIEFSRRIGPAIGEVLARAPVAEGRAVEDMAVRARLAAAFRAKFPEESSGD